ncbi:hypothetical protein [Brevibacillus laterosporus]|uniref:hypothetical protein n=1 Tax=Brevibacillus laterosporus TaxID=1465 RepID=UPI0021573F05|nr:hypothetical protein [Brevibacillus laterosporus]
MPSKPLKTCLHSRCPTLTREALLPFASKETKSSNMIGNVDQLRNVVMMPSGEKLE